MNCCSNCFNDKELLNIINSNASNIGDCNFCGTSNTTIINPRELEEKFVSLIEIYEPITPPVREDLSPALFHVKIQEDWAIFNENINSEIHQDLLKEILAASFKSDDELFTSPHELRVLLHGLEEAEDLEREWESFAKEIKTKNRFFLNESINHNLLSELFRFLEHEYKKGKLFYRGRISKEKGYKMEDMGKPPEGKNNSGRANPIGIPYLYVATAPKTVLYESRTTHSDFITIAEFRLKDDEMHVLRLRKVDDLSPFLLDDGLERYLKYRKYLQRLEKELSKPLRRHDNEMLDYLPTQYLCEYVKSLGYDAIEYGSSLHEGGINLAVFDDSKLEIIDVTLYEVVSIELGTKPKVEPE